MKLVLTYLFFGCLLVSWNLPLYGQSSEEIADDNYKKGKEKYYDGEYEIADSLFQDALQNYTATLGQNHSKVAKTYRRLGDVYRRLRFHRSALDYYAQGLHIAEGLPDYPLDEIAQFHMRTGSVYNQMYRSREAQAAFQRCLGMYREAFGEVSEKVATIYMNIGINQTKMSNYRDAERNYLKAFDIYQEVAAPNSVAFNRIYLNMSTLYRRIGDYDRAVTYGENALNIKLMNYPPDHPSIPKYYRAIGRALEQSGELDKALPYFEKTLALAITSIGPDHPETGGAYGELGNIKAELGEYDAAIAAYQQALQIMERRLDLTHPYLVGGYFNLGRVYENQGQYERALVYYRTVLDKFSQREAPPPKLLAQTKRAIARTYLLAEQPDTAIYWLNRGLKDFVNVADFRTNDLYANPSLSEVQADKEVMNLLRYKAQAFSLRAQQQGRAADWRAAFQCSRLAIELINRLRRTYPSERSRQYLNEKAASVYGASIEQCYALYQVTDSIHYLQQAMELSAQSKASILWQHLQQDQARHIAGIPETAIEVIQRLERNLQAAREAMADSSSNLSRRQLQEAELAFLQAENELERQYPNYNLQRLALAPLRIDQLQAKLAKTRSALIDYFYHDDQLFVFVLTENGLKAFQAKADEQFRTDIEKVRSQQLTQLLGQADMNTHFMEAIARLDQQLIGDLRSTLAGLDHLVIIPHDRLHYLSFEMLAPRPQQADFASMNYLLRDFSISYQWSAIFWLKQGAEKQRSDFARNFTGFSPAFSDTTEAVAYRTLPYDLRYNEEEVIGAQQYFSGIVRKGTAASEAAFLELAPESRVLHLATHGLANDQFPLQSGLFFSATSDSLEDGFLSALEIYGLQLPAEMAVISACNTGYGRLATGEGVMSLGRAFSYAGCRSVLMSLWLANDQSTSEIMSYFYAHLKEGYAKDEALRLAKLNYLDHADPVAAHPYFWANIVAIGEMEPLTTTGKGFKQQWLFYLLGLIVLVIVFRRRVLPT